MNGTKVKKYVPAIVVILLVLIVAVTIWENSNLKKSEGIRQEISEEENFAASYMDGYMVGKYWQLVNMAISTGEVSEKEMDRFNDHIDRTLEDASFENQKKLYDYLSRIFDREITFYYHESTDQDAYARGYLNQVAVYGIQLMAAMDEISQEDYETILELDYQAFIDPTEENTLELMKVISEIVMKAAMGESIT